jgi:hypothetical protein
MADLAVIVHTTDYRGDHSAEVALVVRVPLTATVADLLTLAAKYDRHHVAWVEVKPEGSDAREGRE